MHTLPELVHIEEKNAYSRDWRDLIIFSEMYNLNMDANDP